MVVGFIIMVMSRVRVTIPIRSSMPSMLLMGMSVGAAGVRIMMRRQVSACGPAHGIEEFAALDLEGLRRRAEHVELLLAADQHVDWGPPRSASRPTRSWGPILPKSLPKLASGHITHNYPL